MPRAGVYAITDPQLLPGELLFTAVHAALEGGISLLQFRAKGLGTAESLRCLERLLALSRQYAVPLLVNDDLSLCLASGADGVHLGQSDGDIREARARLGDGRIIGITCHDSIDLALAATHGGADYVAFGRFFDSNTKPHAPPAALEVLARAKAQITVPSVAIGGINEENARFVLDAGASLLAVIGGLFDHGIEKATLRAQAGGLGEIVYSATRAKTQAMVELCRESERSVGSSTEPTL